MPFTAADVLEVAREIHPLADLQQHPQATLWRELTRYQRRLLVKGAQHNRYFNTTHIDVPLPVVPFEDGYDLSGTPFVRMTPDTHVRNVNQRDWETFNLIDGPSRYITRWPAGWIQWPKLYLIGREHEWAGFDLIRLTAVAEPVAITGGGDSVALPDGALNVLGARLAYFMGRRLRREGDAKTVDELQTVWAEAETDWFDELQERDGATKSIVRDVT